MAPSPAARQRDRWTTSYADFVTILLVLFVAIAAQGLQSAVPLKVAIPVAAAPEPAPVVRVALPLPPKPPAILAALAPLEALGVKLKVESRGIVISLEQKVLFDSGDDRISDQALLVISEIAGVLRGVPNKISLIGHADSRPIHSKRFRDNWELSVARSLRLRELLSREFGIAEGRLSVASLGANDPVDSEDTEEGRANNRRVEFVIADEGVLP
ncbi:MAG TPA: OmpA family protein [Bryobacteraceae bacterium]